MHKKLGVVGAMPPTHYLSKPRGGGGGCIQAPPPGGAYILSIGGPPHPEPIMGTHTKQTNDPL